MRLLVVTPTLGRSEYLIPAIASVRRLDLDVEHVLVAPGSTLERLRKEFPHCTVVDEAAPAGMYAAIEAGIRAAAPWDWYTYLNDDDLLGDAFADVASAHMAAGDARAVAYGDVEWIDAEGASLGLMPIEKHQAHVGYAIKLGLAPLTQQGAIVSRSLHSELGGFDTRFRLAADFDYWARAYVAGAKFRYYPARVASWRIHGSQASMDRAGVSHETSLVTAALPLAPSQWRLKWERFRFRLLNVNRYVDRRRRTGQWRSEALFAAAATLPE